MSRIEFPKKQRKDGGVWQDPDGTQVFIGKDYALQNEIAEVKQKTQSRSCFTACRTCSNCANSRRDTSYPFRYDSNAGKMIHCGGCEKFSFHDCNNGFLRDSRQEAEPFTEEAQKIIDQQGGKPLI